MTKSELETEQERLQAVLDSYESGRVTHLSEDERGNLTRNTTGERIESLKQQVVDVKRRIKDDRNQP